MTEKRIRSRLVNKHDIEINWNLAINFVPLAGELIIYDSEVDDEGNVLTTVVDDETVPALPGYMKDTTDSRITPITYERFKIGDGKHITKDLPFVTDPADQHISITAGNPHGITKEMIGVVDTYTNEDPMLNNVGGILASNHTQGFNNVPITDLITELLYPYTAPVINTLTMTPSAIVRKKGTEVTVTGATVKVSKKTKPISSVVLYKGSTVMSTISSPTPSSSGTVLTFPAFSDTIDGSSNVTYTAKVSEQDGTANVASTTATFTFVNPYYWGAIAADADITPETISALSEDIRVKGNHSREYTTINEKPVLAYPKSYGLLASITDAALPYTWDRYGDDSNFKINNEAYYVYVGSTSTLTNTYNFKY